jgi:hypothetical protein
MDVGIVSEVNLRVKGHGSLSSGSFGRIRAAALLCSSARATLGVGCAGVV